MVTWNCRLVVAGDEEMLDRFRRFASADYNQLAFANFMPVPLRAVRIDYWALNNWGCNGVHRVRPLRKPGCVVYQYDADGGAGRAAIRKMSALFPTLYFYFGRHKTRTRFGWLGRFRCGVEEGGTMTTSNGWKEPIVGVER